MPNMKSVSVAPVQSSTNSVDNVDSMSPDQVLKVSPTVEPGPSEMYPSAPSKSDHNDVVKDLKEFHSNFMLSEKPTKKTKDVQPQSADKVDATAAKTAASPIPETIPLASDVPKTDEKKSPKTVEPADSILSKSKLNPLAKEFKFTPKSQKPSPSPQPQFVNVVAASPFSPTSVRAPLGASPFPHPQQVMMVSPQQFNVYRGKQPFNKPARGQSYGGREQGESPPFISAAAATGSPIIAPGVGTFPPQQVYQIPSHQPVAYVQSPAGMVPSPQQMMQQYVVPTGPTRFIAPVSSPAGGAAAVPMSQAYQDGSPVPVYVTGNMAAMQSAGTPQGQPQPSPSQQGQFIFTPVPQMPGQPQATGPHQGQVTPGQFGQSPLVYIPQVTPNASAPTSASSSVSYMHGAFHGDRIQ
ncbi:basic salivary proline-rich protein 4-like [Orbicella faveolata]|uniref:basic salivary proline-rich protein 4-like n=1 Tax=Orbicella faveolata TaxID=48498 RepID=UPI0009E3C7B2|nr:basic salivary proline-rich protein 4-like [Orbicella faveolata]